MPGKAISKRPGSRPSEFEGKRPPNPPSPEEKAARKRAEAELAQVLARANDPAVFAAAAAEDDSAFEPINQAHDDLVRRSRHALARRHRGTKRRLAACTP